MTVQELRELLQELEANGLADYEVVNTREHTPDITVFDVAQQVEIG